MTTTRIRRSVILAGFSILVLLALALIAEPSQAITSSGAGVGGSAGVAQLSQAQVQAALVRHDQLDQVQAAVIPVAGVQSSSTGGMSATTWVILAVALAALAIGSWVLVRRRSVARSEAARRFCTLNPDDAKCSTA